MKKRISRFLFLASFMAIAGSNGCDSDSVSHPVSTCDDACEPNELKCEGNDVYICQKDQEDADACFTWKLKETCSDGKHCDEAKHECIGDCSETCDTAAPKRCSANGLEECTPDENGCASWSVIDPCENGSCNPETLQCTEDDEPCTSNCDPDETPKKCEGNEIYTCEETQDACYTWVTAKTCDSGQHCDETSFECVEGCSEVCDDEALKRCSANGLEECTPDEAGCASWSVIDSCENGTCDPETLQCTGGEALCTSNCDPSETAKKCDGSEVYACTETETDCYQWALETACDSDQHCDEETAQCVPNCQETCDPGNSQRCTEKGLEKCTPDEAGCASWSVTDPCTGGSCDPTTLKCVATCNNQCNANQRKCDKNSVVECTQNASGCLVWGTPKQCTGGYCDSKTSACVSCNNQCSKNQKKCNNKTYMTCQSDSNGCYAWKTEKTCTEEQSCNVTAAGCIASCTSNCTKKGDKETHATSQKVCTDVNGYGCLQWKETKCKKGEKFDTATNKCVSVCGNECEPFSIVFLPDSQEYTRKIEGDGNGYYKKTDGSVDIFTDQLKWINENKDTYNIKAVVHLGDLTDTNTELAWKFVNESITKYLDTKKMKPNDDVNGPYIPYILTPGNHDYKLCQKAGVSNDDAIVSIDHTTDGKKDCNCIVGGTTFGRSDTLYYYDNVQIGDKVIKGGNFNKKRLSFNERPWYKDYSQSDDQSVPEGISFITFKAANIDFLILSLEYLPRESIVIKANDILKNDKYKNHKVIIVTHAYLDPTNINYNHCTTLPDNNNNKHINVNGQFISGYSKASGDENKGLGETNSGGYLRDNLIFKHNNIILVANGHVSGSCFRLNKGNNENTFAEMAVDYQIEDGLGKSGGRCEHTHDRGGSGSGWLRVLKFDPKKYTVESITVSSLIDARFSGGKAKFFCTKKSYPNDESKQLYPEEPAPNNKPTLNIKGTRLTNHHAFTVTDFDFVTPVDHKSK